MCYFYIMYILENYMIIYDILHLHFIPHTEKIQGSNAVLYWPNPPADY